MLNAPPLKRIILEETFFGYVANLFRRYRRALSEGLLLLSSA
jgi:hypothetical protein